MVDTNDVDTQIEEDLNTETNLEEEQVGTEEQVEESEDSSSQQSTELDPDSIFDLDDEQFIEFYNSGKLPENIVKTKKSRGEKESDDESTLDTGRTNERIDSNKSDNRLSDSNKTPTVETVSSEDKFEEKSEKKSTEIVKTSTKDSTKKSEEIDYKKTYESIFKPFKANGKELTPRTAEDVISLMQMGANYTKKMQAMAPMRKIVESLNKASITDDDLNFLIDIHKGDKEAIKKLLKKHEVDPIDLDMDATNYVPKNNMISDEDVEYSGILDDIQDSLPKIQEIINKTWDAKSKSALLLHPDLMKGLAEEIELGRFDEVQNRLELEKTFGRYRGKSDLEAYMDLVSKMYPINGATNTNKPSAVNRSSNTSNKKIPDKSKVAPNKTKASNGKPTITAKDLFSMSDEEILKINLKDLY